jgi:uncharacterized repeat protein (TIGR01451 family)
MTQLIHRVLAFLCVSLVGLALAVFPAAAEPNTTSALLLPYFEVDLGGARTTLFALGNGHAEPVQVQVAVFTNWGIPVLRLTLDLGPAELVTVDLRDWIEAGVLPTQTLGPARIAHLQAALTGQQSPEDGRYYGTPSDPGLAIGFVTFRVMGPHRHDGLWGDYFWIDTATGAAEGVLLLDIDVTSDRRGLCERHLVRFLTPDSFGGTDLVIWTGRYGAPSPVPEPKFRIVDVIGNAFYSEDGVEFDKRFFDVLSLSLIHLDELDLAESSGWIDIVSATPIYVGTRHRSGNHAVAVESWCQKKPPPEPLFVARPGIDLEKLTGGMDADIPPGPVLEIGGNVTWQYVVTNTGNVRLNDIVVSDNRGVAVSCPATSLGPHKSMTCTGSGVVQAGSYSNIGTVTANTPDGAPVTDSDPSHYRGVSFFPDIAAIDIEKMTNGHPADTPPGPTLVAGDQVTWTYSVVNVGGTALAGVTVVDSDPAVTVSCPATVVAVSQTMVCSASGTALVGQYANVATATGTGGGMTVSKQDPSHYFGVPEPPPPGEPAIEIEKLTNGFDADGVASAPQLYHGHPVVWTYVVTNVGNVVLGNVAVTDDKGVAVSCPKTTLEPGEQMICTASGTAVASEECYANVGTVVGSPPEGDNVTDSDPSHYCAQEVPGEAAIHVEKYTNGEDADVAPGPSLLPGDNVQWVYVVTNPGDLTLVGVTVTDDQGVTVTCSGGQPFVLEPGQAKTCFANGLAQVGQYANVGTATGTPEGGGDAVSDSDASHYLGQVGNQGCTPGYWKNHTDSWPPTGYATGDKVKDVFADAGGFPTQGNATLLEALGFSGGPGVDGAAEILLRAGVAALLNASHPSVAYPRTPAQVLSAVNAALASHDRDTMLAIAAALDADNNLGCPLS